MRGFIGNVICRSLLAGAFTLACGNDDGDTPTGDQICANGECTFTSNLCSPNPCEHGGTCRRGVGDYACICEPGFRGDHCEIVDDDCASNPCQNGGSCTDGDNAYTCTCVVGFAGADCSINVDDCVGHLCEHGGTCIDGVNAYSCSCPTGYSGETCETNIDDCNVEACLNGGTCVDGVNAYTCDCATGFTGADCSLNIDDCDPDPCLNGGDCSDGVNAFTCACASGFEGATCATNIDDCDPNPCLNGGDCSDGLNDFTCACANGFEGDTCQTDIDECIASTDDCDVDATCGNTTGSYTCTCNTGYEGTGQSCASSALSSLVLDTGAFDQTFDAAVTSYTQTVGCDVDATLLPTALDPSATIELRYRSGSNSFTSFAAITSGVSSSSIPLDVGTNDVEVRVTASGATTRTYEITVERVGAGLECGLRALYSFEEGVLASTPSDPSFADGSGNEMSLIAEGAVDPTVLGFDGVGKAIALPGTSGVFVTNDEVLTDEKLTFAFWLKADSLPPPTERSCPVGLAAGGVAEGTHDKDVFVDSDGKLFLYVFDGGPLFTSTPSTSIVPGTWYHVTAVVDFPTSSLYIDGGLAGTAVVASSFTGYNVPDLFLGGTNGQGVAPFDGAIDQLAIWSRPLTPQEVTEVFAADAFGTCEIVAGVSNCTCGGSDPGTVACGTN